MTSLCVICGLGPPPIKNPGYAYAKACNEFAGPISASLRPGNTAPFEETSQRWRAVDKTVSDLTGPRFEPRTSRSRDKRVTARPTGRAGAFPSFEVT